LSAIDLLFMENLGTLLHADADVGLDALAVVFSVAQGQGQPEKHPHLVSKADVILLNKVDLLPSVAYDLNAFRGSVQRIHPGVTTLEVSALLREKLEPWVGWLKSRIYKNLNGNAMKQNGSHWFG
jgi:hydrogenase nickel incorporation protein HypB